MLSIHFGKWVKMLLMIVEVNLPPAFCAIRLSIAFIWFSVKYIFIPIFGISPLISSTVSPVLIGKDESRLTTSAATRLYFAKIDAQRPSTEYSFVNKSR